jgi:putative FmdB family regulatory protein
MPVYEYICAEGHQFERLMPVEFYNWLQYCPRCDSPSQKVILCPPRVFSDYDGYESPASGKWIEGRVARERDLRETNCVPYDPGMKADQARYEKQREAQLDSLVDEAVERTLTDLTL